MTKNIYLFIFLTFLSSITVISQNVLKGSVKDEFDKTPIPFAQIRLSCSPNVAVADINGNFSIPIPKDSCEVSIHQSMFELYKQTIIFTSKRREIRLDVLLKPHAMRLEETKVTASKYETSPELATNSIVILQPKQSENKNFISMDNLINTAGGIVVVDNEPQIRGGSGYSSGMGSRVMILLDDMPLLRPDAGRPMWNFIPMESVEQVEILKGAASVLYGSAALTGAINVLTAYPRTKPQTSITAFAGLYDKPRNAYQTSWINQNPIQYGLSFSHSRIIKKNFDLVIGGELFQDQSYIGPEERVSTTRANNSSSRGKSDARYRLNFASRYRFEKVKGLSISLNGNFMYSNNRQSFIWFDADTNIFRTYDGSLYQFKEFTFYVDPTIAYVGKKGSVHTFRNRVLFSDNHELTGALDTKAMMVFDEYQFNKTFNKIGMGIVAGVSNQHSYSHGHVFSGVGDPHSIEGEKPASTAFANNLAFYGQIEQKFFKKRNLTLQAGVRWEFYNLWGETIETEQKNKPICRVGVNYQISKVKTAFRASWGQGYRFPTIGEKFISLTVGDYGFYPNPQLKSETSWNAEIGIIQPFQFFDFRGMFDIAYFHQEYKDFIEFSMGAWGNSSVMQRRIGYKFLNIGPAKVNGIDCSLIGEGKIGKNVSYTLMAAYTWSNPTTKDRNLVYYTYKATETSKPVDYSFINSSSDTVRSVLKYRIEHMVKGDLEFTLIKKFGIGATINWYSSMKNVDKFMFNYDANNPTHSVDLNNTLKQVGDVPFWNFYNFFQASKGGAVTLDLRASFYFNKLSVTFIIKNVTNKLYALRPLYAEPTRTYTLQLIYKMN